MATLVIRTFSKGYNPDFTNKGLLLYISDKSHSLLLVKVLGFLLDLLVYGYYRLIFKRKQGIVFSHFCQATRKRLFKVNTWLNIILMRFDSIEAEDSEKKLIEPIFVLLYKLTLKFIH